MCVCTKLIPKQWPDKVQKEPEPKTAGLTAPDRFSPDHRTQASSSMNWTSDGQDRCDTATATNRIDILF